MGAILAMMAAATSTCTLPPGWDAVAARKTPYVIFGEYHGTEEAPAFVGNVVCALARRKQRVLVALEITSGEDPDLQAAWRRPAGAFADAAVATIVDWSADRGGGPMSSATLAMLDRLHRLKTRGAKIDVVAFNGVRDDAQRAKFADLGDVGGHEAAQAENIRLAAERGRYDKVIVLVGNYHARKKPIVRGGITYEPMAMRLAPPAQVTSLDLAYGDGTAFSCQMREGFTPVAGKPVTKADVDCRPRPLRGMPLPAGPARIALAETPWTREPALFDGYYWVGPIRAAGVAAPVPAKDNASQ